MPVKAVEFFFGKSVLVSIDENMQDSVIFLRLEFEVGKSVKSFERVIRKQ